MPGHTCTHAAKVARGLATDSWACSLGSIYLNTLFAKPAQGSVDQHLLSILIAQETTRNPTSHCMESVSLQYRTSLHSTQLLYSLQESSPQFRNTLHNTEILFTIQDNGQARGHDREQNREHDRKHDREQDRKQWRYALEKCFRYTQGKLCDAGLVSVAKLTTSIDCYMAPLGQS